MRNIFISIFIVFFSLSNQLLFADEKERKDDHYLLIDVRTKEEYEEGHLEKAINIPYNEIKEKIGEHTKDLNEKILVYCRSGRRSSLAKKSLEELGYKNVENGGAYKDLKKKEKEKKETKKGIGGLTYFGAFGEQNSRLSQLS